MPPFRYVAFTTPNGEIRSAEVEYTTDENLVASLTSVTRQACHPIFTSPVYDKSIHNPVPASPPHTATRYQHVGFIPAGKTLSSYRCVELGLDTPDRDGVGVFNEKYAALKVAAGDIIVLYLSPPYTKPAVVEIRPTATKVAPLANLPVITEEVETELDPEPAPSPSPAPAPPTAPEVPDTP